VEAPGESSLDYTFDDAPAPKIVVVPAQEGHSTKMLDCIRKGSTRAEVMMSVCTVAFTLAEASVLNGGKATVNYSTRATVVSPADGRRTGILGNWDGTVVLKEGSFRVAMHVRPAENGTLTGRLDSLDEDMNDLAVDAVHFEHPALHFEVPSVGGVYGGTLNSGEAKIDGTWTQRGVSRAARADATKVIDGDERVVAFGRRGPAQYHR